MQSPKVYQRNNSSREKGEKSPQNSQKSHLSPNANRPFKPKQLSDLKPIQPSQKSHRSPSSKHQKSFSGLYSKYKQNQHHTQTHQVGYTGDEIKQAVNFIFLTYDSNKDGYLDRNQVKNLISRSLIHMGSNHAPSELQIIEFIYSMDKNSDGKLSRDELEKAFKRANRIDY